MNNWEMAVLGVLSCLLIFKFFDLCEAVKRIQLGLKEISTLRYAVEEIRNDLREIKRKLGSK
jgi:hypothetical protein